MQAHVHARVFLERFDKREVRILVALFKDVLEIATRLVCVDNQDEMKFLGHLAGRISQKTSYLAAGRWQTSKLRAVDKGICRMAEEIYVRVKLSLGVL
jgi:hypothetical protein